jgi:hypothetical protein
MRFEECSGRPSLPISARGVPGNLSTLAGNSISKLIPISFDLNIRVPSLAPRNLSDRHFQVFSHDFSYCIVAHGALAPIADKIKLLIPPLASMHDGEVVATAHAIRRTLASPASVYRYITDQHPTLLIDEADTFVKNNDELRGVLNCGHTRVTANVIRTVEINGEHKASRFSTWCPKALASIRSLADTLEDRAILVEMKRKAPNEKVARLRQRDSEDFQRIRKRAARWAADNCDRFLLAKLYEDASKPWADWMNGKSMSAKMLAALLKPFKVFSKEVSWPTRGNGYEREAFKDAFGRYSPNPPTSKVGRSGSPTGTGTSDNSQSSDKGLPPEHRKDEETAAAVGVPELPRIETPTKRANGYFTNGAGELAGQDGPRERHAQTLSGDLPEFDI